MLSYLMWDVMTRQLWLLNTAPSAKSEARGGIPHIALCADANTHISSLLTPSCHLLLVRRSMIVDVARCTCGNTAEGVHVNMVIGDSRSDLWGPTDKSMFMFKRLTDFFFFYVITHYPDQVDDSLWRGLNSTDHWFSRCQVTALIIDLKQQPQQNRQTRNLFPILKILHLPQRGLTLQFQGMKLSLGSFSSRLIADIFLCSPPSVVHKSLCLSVLVKLDVWWRRRWGCFYFFFCLVFLFCRCFVTLHTCVDMFCWQNPTNFYIFFFPKLGRETVAPHYFLLWHWEKNLFSPKTPGPGTSAGP